MTDLYAESLGVAPEPDLSQRLSYGLDMIGAPDLAGLIATAGLAAVYEQLQRTRHMLGENVRAELAIGRQIAHLTDEARRWKRRWAGAVAQAKREHARAEELARTCPPECAKEHGYDGACLLDPILEGVIAGKDTGPGAGWSWSCSTDDGCGHLGLGHTTAAAARRSYERHLRSDIHREYATEAHTSGENARLRRELASLHEGEEPYAPNIEMRLPGQLIWAFNHSTPAERLDLAARILTARNQAELCSLDNHPRRLAALQAQLDHLTGQLAAERLANEELRRERADLRLAVSVFDGAKARAAATAATEQLPLPVHFSPAMLRQAASAIADEADRGEKAGAVRIYLRGFANKLRQVAEGRAAYEREQAGGEQP